MSETERWGDSVRPAGPPCAGSEWTRCELSDEPQQIRIIFEGLQGYVPTALVALTVEDAERLCDRLNARLGHSREDWTALAARSMRTEAPEIGDESLH